LKSGGVLSLSRRVPHDRTAGEDRLAGHDAAVLDGHLLSSIVEQAALELGHEIDIESPTPPLARPGHHVVIRALRKPTSRPSGSRKDPRPAFTSGVPPWSVEEDYVFT